MDATASRLRAATVSVWLGRSPELRRPPGPGSIQDVLTGSIDQRLLELLAVTRALPRTGHALRYALHFSVWRCFEDGTLACSGCVEFDTLAALVTFAETHRLTPGDASVQTQGRPLPTWRYMIGKRGKTPGRWKRPDEVEEDEGGTRRVSVR